MRETNIEINGVTLELKDWLTYLKISKQALADSAKRRGFTSSEELKRRFTKKLELFPKHLL